MGSFALTVGTFILVSGKLGDIFGLKLIFCIGWFWIAISSLITGLSVYSDSVVFFIICRAIQGIGFALLLPCGMGILGTVYSSGTMNKKPRVWVGGSKSSSRCHDLYRYGSGNRPIVVVAVVFLDFGHSMIWVWNCLNCVYSRYCQVTISPS
jgi:hypothetical protein